MMRNPKSKKRDDAKCKVGYNSLKIEIVEPNRPKMINSFKLLMRLKRKLPDMNGYIPGIAPIGRSRETSGQRKLKRRFHLV